MNRLRGFAIAGYRSFGDKQYFSNLGTLNFFVGQNNAGKTNALQFLLKVLNRSDRYSQLPIDKPRELGFEGATAWSIALTPEDLALQFQAYPNSQMIAAIRHLFMRDEFDAEPANDLFWIDLQHDTSGTPFFSQARTLEEFRGEEGITLASIETLKSISSSLTIFHNAGANLRTILEHASLLAPLRSLNVIESQRRVRDVQQGEMDTVLDGRGLTKRLHAMQHPEWDQEDLQRKFLDISELLQELFEDSSAGIEIVHDAKDILVTHRGKKLPLERHGLGIQQLTILSALICTSSPTVFLVEEPEVNLHPTMQRKLASVLSARAEHQYLIATHSAHLLDYENASVHHLSLTSTGTKVRVVKSPDDAHTICKDLGYKASDLLQSNCVIWVEGPSDRIYLKYLLESVGAKAFPWRESVHYSIMIYGGALLNSLTTEDPSVEAFINLTRLNRNMAVVMDSDRKDEHESASKAKLRIEEEFAERGSVESAWITWGYTFENYVPVEVLASAFRKVHPNKNFAWSGDRLENPFSDSRVDKIAIAHSACDSWVFFERDARGDLASRLHNLRLLVGKANV